MKLIDKDETKVVLEMSRKELLLLCSITLAASQDFEDLDQASLQASLEDVDTINDEMYRVLTSNPVKDAN